VPVVHIEAGLRSYNKSMPEEINRILCDHVSTFLFSPTKAGLDNLKKEGFRENNEPPYSFDNPKIYHCGDVMYDNSLYFSSIAEKKSSLLAEQGLESGNYVLATIHRNNNTDEPERLNTLFSAIYKIATEKGMKVVIPMHPRTSKLLPQNLSPELYSKVKTNAGIRIIPPASFLEMIALEKNAKLVMTDSGGVQKEAFFFQKPCIILRSETEWIELVQCGSAIVADANEKRIIEAYDQLSSATDLKFPALFGNGKAAEFICTELLRYLS
jgi:UDP-GlcNAc3NAcA epimerase